MSAAVTIHPSSVLAPSVIAAPLAKCSPRQVEELRTLAEIFLQMFLDLSPDQRKLYSADSACTAQPLSIHSVCEKERHLA